LFAGFPSDSCKALTLLNMFLWMYVCGPVILFVSHLSSWTVGAAAYDGSEMYTFSNVIRDVGELGGFTIWKLCTRNTLYVLILLRPARERATYSWTTLKQCNAISNVLARVTIFPMHHWVTWLFMYIMLIPFDTFESNCSPRNVFMCIRVTYLVVCLFNSVIHVAYVW